MGYYANQKSENMRIKKENFEQLSKSLCAAFTDLHYGTDEKTLTDSFDYMGFEPSFEDGTGDIDSVTFNGEKWPSEIDDFLKAIAPFVSSGSYMTFCGEDGALWKYIFQDKQYQEEIGEIVYTSDDKYVVAVFGSGEFQIFGVAFTEANAANMVRDAAKKIEEQMLDRCFSYEMQDIENGVEFTYVDDDGKTMQTSVQIHVAY